MNVGSVTIIPAFAGIDKNTKNHIQIFKIKTTETNDTKVLNFIRTNLKTGDIPQIIAVKKEKSNQGYELRKTPYGYEYIIHSF